MVLPAVVLWLLATVVSAGVFHPFDVTEYAQYAHGALRFPLLHHLPREYPAPAVVIFLLPLLLPFSYPWAFAVFAGVALLVLLTAYRRVEVEGWDEHGARRLLVYLTLGSVMVLTGRYDIFAVAAAFLSVRAARRGRWGAAWTWSSVGFAVKLFPAAFWPVFLVAEWRATGRLPLRRLAWMAGAAFLVAGFPALVDRGAALTVLHYYLHRPTEIGSLPAGLSVLLDFHSVSWLTSFHSANLVSGVTAGLSIAVEAVAGLGCLWTWWALARGRLSLEAACLATLTLTVLGSKVLSVQYLMWLMPLWALYRPRVTWLLAATANLVVFPYAAAAQNVGHLSDHAFAVTLTLAFFGRDLLVAIGTAAWLRSEWRSPGRAARTRPGRAPLSGQDSDVPGLSTGMGTSLLADML